MTKVKVTANPETGSVFNLTKDEQGNPKVDKNGSQYGTIRVESQSFNPAFIYLNGGVEKRSALIGMLAIAFEKAKEFYKPGLELDGKIRVTETIDENTHKNGVGTGYSVKKAGPDVDAPILTAGGGKPIYRRTEFVSANSPLFLENDLLIMHENKIVRAEVKKEEVAAEKSTLN